MSHCGSCLPGRVAQPIHLTFLFMQDSYHTRLSVVELFLIPSTSGSTFFGSWLGRDSSIILLFYFPHLNHLHMTFNRLCKEVPVLDREENLFRFGLTQPEFSGLLTPLLAQDILDNNLPGSLLFFILFTFIIYCNKQ